MKEDRQYSCLLVENQKEIIVNRKGEGARFLQDPVQQRIGGTDGSAGKVAAE